MWETLKKMKGRKEKVKDDFQDLAWVAMNGNVMFENKKQPCKEENSLEFWRQSQTALERRMNVI